MDQTQIGGIKLLLMDCDGVLTDGRLYFSDRGEELKVFHVRDGQGLALWHKAGFRSGIISGRGAGKIITNRANELGVEFVKVNSKDKIQDLQDILADAGLGLNETAFIGDDLGDLDVIRAVGMGVAVADAVQEIKNAADHITETKGGFGAVRELVEMILSAKNEQI